MATKNAVATKTRKKESAGKMFNYIGQDRASGRAVSGEIIALNEAEVKIKLARRNIKITSVTKAKAARGKKIKAKDITIFTRQMSTMMQAGIPLLQSFEIAAKGQANQKMMDLLLAIRADIGAGASMGTAFSRHPNQFNNLYCSLVAAGEAGGVLDIMLDKLASYQEKIDSIRRKVKSALTYPIIVMCVAVGLIMVMMIFVLPAFKKVYDGMGVDLPPLTQFLMNMSNFFVSNAIIIVALIAAVVIGIPQMIKRSPAMQKRRDAILLKLPVFGAIVYKSTVARWARTLATLFTAGVPLVDALNTVGGASGNIIYEEGTKQIQQDVKKGVSLTFSMNASNLFPVMVVQMASIGEESGALDDMLNKSAEFLEDEVDGLVATLSAMLEPFIIVFLGLVVGVILVAMYLPLFTMGDALG